MACTRCTPPPDVQDLLDLHREALVEDSLDSIEGDPTLRPVGMILVPDSPEAVRLAQAVGEEVGKGFVGLVERPFALSILRQGAPALLDWLVESTAVEFPVVVANGLRVWTGSVVL